MRSVLVLFLLAAATTGLALTAGCQTEAADAGPTERCVIDVQGMTCEGCANAVKAAVEKVPGVKSADVSLQKNQVVVLSEPEKPVTDQVVAAITEAGYEAKLTGEGP